MRREHKQHDITDIIVFNIDVNAYISNKMSHFAVGGKGRFN